MTGCTSKQQPSKWRTDDPPHGEWIIGKLLNEDTGFQKVIAAPCFYDYERMGWIKAGIDYRGWMALSYIGTIGPKEWHLISL